VIVRKAYECEQASIERYQLIEQLIIVLTICKKQLQNFKGHGQKRCGEARQQHTIAFLFGILAPGS
jgi:hypothetical protein